MYSNFYNDEYVAEQSKLLIIVGSKTVILYSFCDSPFLFKIYEYLTKIVKN